MMQRAWATRAGQPARLPPVPACEDEFGSRLNYLRGLRRRSRLEFPDQSKVRQHGQVGGRLELESRLTLFVVELVLDAAVVAPVRGIGDLEIDSQQTAFEGEVPGRPQVEREIAAETARVARAGLGHRDRLH